MTYFWAVLSQKKDIFGDFADKYFHGSWWKHETWYNYGLSIACKNRKGGHILGHCLSLNWSKTDNFGGFC